MEFDDLLENKRTKLDGILNGDPSAGKPASAPGKPNATFRRVQ
jgi:hypothetical protein